MRNINYLKFLVIFGLLISLGFSTETYDVEYMESVTVDASSSEWNSIDSQNFYDFNSGELIND